MRIAGRDTPISRPGPNGRLLWKVRPGGPRAISRGCVGVLCWCDGSNRTERTYGTYRADRTYRSRDNAAHVIRYAFYIAAKRRRPIGPVCPIGPMETTCPLTRLPPTGNLSTPLHFHAERSPLTTYPSAGSAAAEDTGLATLSSTGRTRLPHRRIRYQRIVRSTAK